MFGAGLAHAEPITWYLQGVTFADGATVSGSFDYDANTNVYSNVAVSSTSGSAFAGDDYSYGMLIAEFTPSATSVNFSPASQPVAKDGELMIDFLSALTNAGGTVEIATAGSLSKEGLCAEAPLIPKENLSCDGGGLVNWLRIIAQGSVTTTIK